MDKLGVTVPFGRTGLRVPPIVFGTSCLGNLYEALDDERKLAIVREWFACVAPPVVADSAGKYGAGLALETVGRALGELGIDREKVLVSNKLGWKRVPLSGPEPTFEKGVWAGIDHDAVQSIDYDGILECYQQGCDLLGFAPAMVSVHDPDEYLAAAVSADDRKRRWEDVLGAYRALIELRDSTPDVRGVGVGAKDWTAVREVAREVDLDWVMFACSLTVRSHPPELLEFMAELHARGVAMINSAVFHAGFLTGGRFFDYRVPDPTADADLFRWRERFQQLCRSHGVKPAEACVRFGMSVPGVVAVALNTGKPHRIADNVRAVQADIPGGFWRDMKHAGLIASHFPYVG